MIKHFFKSTKLNKEVYLSSLVIIFIIEIEAVMIDVK